MQTLQTAGFFALLAVSLAAPLQPLSESDTTVRDPSHNEHVQRSEGADRCSPNVTECEADVTRRLGGLNDVVMHYVLSRATGHFVAITKSGRVQANVQIGRVVAQFFISYTLINGQEYTSLQSVKYESRGWFLTVQQNRKIRGGVPSNGNELFEVVVVSGSFVALKAPNNNMRDIIGLGSGEGENTTEEPDDCYIGFSVADGRPACYSSINHVETLLLFLDASSR